MYVVDTESTGTSKEVAYSVSCLLLELARVDADQTTVTSFIEDVKIESDRAQILSRTFLV